MIESTTNSNEFRSKGGTVIRIPDADFNIIPRSVTKNTTPGSTHIQTTTICANNQGLIGLIECSQIPMVRPLLVKERAESGFNGDFEVEDQHGGGREKVFKDAELEALLDQDSCQTQQEL
ncbi:mariner Mos1 transposase [Trichonephila clavipes]|nr:mariner Mos1 transposase [Trichonephila clavipes]